MIRNHTKQSNLITHYIPGSVPGKCPSTTDCLDIESYLRECQERAALGWLANYARTLEQGMEAYRRGLSNHKPHENDPFAVYFADLRPEPLSLIEQERFIATAAQSPEFCKAFANVVKRGCRS
ncbi:MAG: hypothetical protein KDA78_18230 [Planctomycetaceae bacterium]|nr:hypothetical protein [Planctomycetaceae bacterium]